MLIPLGILDSAGNTPVDGSTRFQKLVFLIEEEVTGSSDEPYEFVPGDYGPFSAQLAYEIDRLIDKGYIRKKVVDSEADDEAEKHVYDLTQSGQNALDRKRGGEDLPEDWVGAIESITRERIDQGLWDLLEYVYKEFPEMAKNSELNIPVE